MGVIKDEVRACRTHGRHKNILQEYLKGRNHLDGCWRILKRVLKIEE
jgi:hypothetical protein